MPVGRKVVIVGVRRIFNSGYRESRMREGCKPMERVDVVGSSASPSPCSSYQPSPCASYNPSPIASSFPSPKSSPYTSNADNAINSADPNSLIPWLRNLSSSSYASSSKLPNHHCLYINTGSISAPVTPPLSSPTACSPRIKTAWDDSKAQPSWPSSNYTSLPCSVPPSPGKHVISDHGWLAAIQNSTGNPASPTFSLVSSNPFGSYNQARGSSRMWTPGQSGTCSPVIPGGPDRADVHMSDGISDEFAFGSSSCGTHPNMTLVKPWEGEIIHEECGPDELELTLGSSRTKSDA